VQIKIKCNKKEIRMYSKKRYFFNKRRPYIRGGSSFTQKASKLKSIFKKKTQLADDLRKLDLFQNETTRRRCFGSNASPIVEYSIHIKYEGVPYIDNLEDEATRKFNHDRLDDLQVMLYTKSVFHFESNNNILYRNIQKNIGENTSLIDFENLFDNEWMKNQIAQLTKRDLFTIYSYTRTGDEIANEFLRKKLTEFKFMRYLNDIQESPHTYRPYFALFFQAFDELTSYTPEELSKSISPHVTPEKLAHIQEWFTSARSSSTLLSQLYIGFLGLLTEFTFDFWLKIIQIYVSDIDRIIKNSPPVTKKMYVYRSVNTRDYFLEGMKHRHIKSLNGFESTSLSAKATFEFIGKKCCFQRITLLPGVRALLISCVSAFPTESEILLGHNTNYYIMEPSTKINKSLNGCDHSVQAVETFDIVMIGNDYQSTRV
jgi:hypothetical protein